MRNGKFYIVISREGLEKMTRHDATWILLHEIGHIITGYYLMKEKKHTISEYMEALLSEAIAQLIALFGIYRLREKLDLTETREIIRSLIKDIIASISLTVLIDCAKELANTLKKVCESESNYEEILRELEVEDCKSLYSHEILAMLVYAVKKYGDKDVPPPVC